MKKTFLIIAALFLSSLHTEAQIEISINPILPFYKVGLFGVNYNLTDDFGVGLDIVYGLVGSAIFLNGKHHFKPRKGTDRFSAGIYGGKIGNIGTPEEVHRGLGIGLLLGYKWVLRRNLTIEFDFGNGRNFSNNHKYFPYIRSNVGYRFNRKTQKK